MTTPPHPTMLYVIKRNGQQERMQFDKITMRLDTLMWDLDREHVFPELVAQKIVAGIKSGMKTSQIDELAAETAGNMTSRHPDYGILAARILVSNLHKQTPTSFSEAMEQLNLKSPAPCRTCGAQDSDSDVEQKDDYPFYFQAEFMRQVRKHRHVLDAAIDHQRDFTFDYFAIQTFLRNSYSTRLENGTPMERPQYMYMRVALALNLDSLPNALACYRALAARQYTHATPTLTSAGVYRGQLCSCFLLAMKRDSLSGIYDTLKQCAMISKQSGGVGMNIHNVRAKGSIIRTSRGKSNGIVPMLRTFNSTSRYVDQGGKRPGSFAVYLELWHADIFNFLNLKLNTGVEEERTRDLFLGLWMCDLFMKRVEAGAAWSLFCPADVPDLCDLYGDKFEARYIEYEAMWGKVRKTIQARDLWTAVLKSQLETGVPYMLYKDACNLKSNQQNLGTIRGSNLCAEIIQYTSRKEVAACNLGSLNLAAFVKNDDPDHPVYDFEALHEVAQLAARNLDRVIDVTVYPLPEAEYSNKRHRPIGLGVQGLADAFILMRMPYESEAAQELNRDIFETIYHAALLASCDLADLHGPYETFQGSPLSQGKFQFDLWGIPATTRYDWEALRSRVVTKGVRNSLLVALMPTASTSQLTGQNEAFEPYTSNLYVRRTQAGEFILVNKHLVHDLQKLGLWTPQVINQLVIDRGSVQKITEIPPPIRAIYKTVWEIPLKIQINMSADRGRFVDQSQSFNVHMNDPTAEKLSNCHFYAWRKGLKTGMYYLRTPPAADPIQFTVDQGLVLRRPVTEVSPANVVEPSPTGAYCTRESGCVACQG